MENSGAAIQFSDLQNVYSDYSLSIRRGSIASHKRLRYCSKNYEEETLINKSENHSAVRSRSIRNQISLIEAREIEIQRKKNISIAKVRQ